MLLFICNGDKEVSCLPNINFPLQIIIPLCSNISLITKHFIRNSLSLHFIQ
jgi:hypothetical protein